MKKQKTEDLYKFVEIGKIKFDGGMIVTFGERLYELRKNKNISHSYVVSDSKQLGSINIKGSINGKLNIPPITVTTLSYSNRKTPANATSDKLDVNMCILVINEEKNTGTLYDLNRISTTYNGSNWVVGNTGCSHTDTWSFEEADFDLGNE